MENEPVSFEELMEEYGRNLKINMSVRTRGGRVDCRDLIFEEDLDYVVDSRSEGKVRYRMKVENGCTIEEWKRFVFPIKRISGSDEPKEEVEVLIEISKIPDKTSPAKAPWEENEEITFSSKTLKDKKNYSPVSANRVAGLDEEKERLRRFLEGNKEDWGLSESTGIILEGPPGTGKTELMMEVCKEEYGSMPVMISGPAILSKWVGESERMLRKKFDEAWDTKHKVLYIDELDAIGRARSEVSESYSAQIVAQLLVLLDGVSAKQKDEEEKNPLKVVASTNLSHVVDPALRRPGRLGSRPIPFGRPSRDERRAILHHYLENIYASDEGNLSRKLQKFVKGENLDVVKDLVKDTEGFTGADLEDLVQDSVNKLRQQEENTLSVSFLKDVLNHGSFGENHDFEEREITRGEIESVEDNPELNYSDSNQILYVLGEERPEEIAKKHFKRIGKTDEDDLTFKFRTISPRDILDSDPTRARENTVQGFQHRENERLCLYFKNIQELLQAQDNSSLITRLIGIINEELLQWENGNLLIIDTNDEKWIDSFPTKTI